MMSAKSPDISRRAALKGGLATAIALPTMATALAACSAEEAEVTSDYAGLITLLCDLIIPQTDTAGAVIAGVPTYARAVVGAYYTPDEQATFKAGLVRFDALAHQEHAASFLKASADQQDAILRQLDLDAAAPREEGLVPVPEHLTWRALKDMVIFGFYTSEAALDELSYEQLPGRFSGDVPLSTIERAWLDRGV